MDSCPNETVLLADECTEMELLAKLEMVSRLQSLCQSDCISSLSMIFTPMVEDSSVTLSQTSKMFSTKKKKKKLQACTDFFSISCKSGQLKITDNSPDYVHVHEVHKIHPQSLHAGRLCTSTETK